VLSFVFWAIHVCLTTFTFYILFLDKYYVEPKTDAISRERFIKTQKSRGLIAQLIDTSFIPGGRLARW
jgi:hypothetical protein